MESIIAESAIAPMNDGEGELTGLHLFAGRDHWFSSTAQTALSLILNWELAPPSGTELGIWFRFSLSRIINRISRQDSETRYVAREKHFSIEDIWRAFSESLAYSKSYLLNRGDLVGDCKVAWADSTVHIPVADETVDCVMTSPPYANTMDYYLYHKQRMNVLGYDFKTVQNTEIGSRWEYSSLKKPLTQWNKQYRNTLLEIRRILRKNARCIIIMGDSQIAGKLVDAAALTDSLAVEAGFRTMGVQSLSMAERTRSFSRAFQRPNKREHIIELKAV